MLRIDRILCPTDFSDFSERAYEYAISLARHYEADLYLLHVVRPVIVGYPEYSIPDSVNEFYGELREYAEEQLREFAKVHAEGGVHAKVTVQEGVVTGSILEFVKENSIDMVVMGTHGRKGFQRLTMGSVTERVLRKAACPVLVVRRSAHDFVSPESGAEPVRLGKILFCSDFSEYSERALQYALSLATEYKSDLSLMHVLEHIPSGQDRDVEIVRARQLLEDSVPEEARSCCSIKPIACVGKPYEEIVKLAEQDQTDLVVMGVRGRNALDLAIFGSTTHRVIQLGPCPVLVIHA